MCLCVLDQYLFINMQKTKKFSLTNFQQINLLFLQATKNEEIEEIFPHYYMYCIESDKNYKFILSRFSLYVSFN